MSILTFVRGLHQVWIDFSWAWLYFANICSKFYFRRTNSVYLTLRATIQTKKKTKSEHSSRRHRWCQLGRGPRHKCEEHSNRERAGNHCNRQGMGRALTRLALRRSRNREGKNRFFEPREKSENFILSPGKFNKADLIPLKAGINIRGHCDL